MTEAQKRSVCLLQDWLHANAGDSAPPNCSPVGDGRWVSLWDVFGRGNAATAHRRNIGRAWHSGDLRRYEIALVDGTAKLVRYDLVREAERDRYLNPPDVSDGVLQARRQSGPPMPECERV